MRITSVTINIRDIPRVQAISAWRDNSGFGRAQLVKQYFLSVEGDSAACADPDT